VTSGDFIPLAASRWRVWQWAVLRSAGFPIAQVDQLAAPDLAHAADSEAAGSAGSRSSTARSATGFHAAFDREIARLPAVINELADDRRLREAIIWQNPKFVGTCLDRGRSAAQRNYRSRQREITIASYVQRYTTKNESIGFFGPVGWAAWVPEVASSSCVPGSDLIARRTAYFESWAIDAVARVFTERPELRAGIPPRQVPANALTNGYVVRPYGAPVALDAEHSAVLRLCDGVKTVPEIAATLRLSEDAVLRMVAELGRLDLIRMDFEGPIETHPERRLRERLSRVPDVAARQRAVAELDRLVQARDKVADAAGDPVLLAERLDTLNRQFEELTSVSASRLEGETYAGRTLVYEDTVRDVELCLGSDVLAALAEPLALVLESGRWLADRIGELYLARLIEYYERKRTSSGSEWIPLTRLLALAARDLYTGSGQPALAAAATAEMQRKWMAVLNPSCDMRRYTVSPQVIGDCVRKEFAATSPRWAGGLQHSPDIMIAAKSVDAINSGEFQLVLGELHLASNTVESRVFVEQCHDRQRLLEMTEMASGKGRWVPVAPRAWGVVTSRTSPPSALLSPEFTYWAVAGDDVAHVPGTVIAVSEMEVGRGSDGLIVRSVTGGPLGHLVDVLGDYMSMVAINAFHLLPPAPHIPRVTMGRLVVSRERWHVPIRKCDWANQLDERRRYLMMREWVARLGLPRRIFCSASVEMKPIYVDFTSIPLTNNLATMIRRMARDKPGGNLVISEMLPDIEDSWLVDADGQAYTAELRMVVTENGC
jgi:hypothetical protein